jgi:hypothetical protein
MYYQDLWDVSASENKYVALFATHSVTYSRYVLEFHKNLLTIRIGFVQNVSCGNQSLLPILVQNCQENRVDVQKCVKLMFLNLIYDAIMLKVPARIHDFIIPKQPVDNRDWFCSKGDLDVS